MAKWKVGMVLAGLVWFGLDWLWFGLALFGLVLCCLGSGGLVKSGFPQDHLILKLVKFIWCILEQFLLFIIHLSGLGWR